ncbi:MAG: hypothetical protein IT317_18530 [Anaerolineales bacterium]|nr:hypothetical protein [Anaerolineales bacterium]
MDAPAPAADTPAILVVSFDAYQDLWPVFFQLFFKYWPDCPYPVYLGTNHATYAHPRVTPVLIGADQDYSANLLAMLAQVPHTWVITWIEDRPPSARVDTARVAQAIAQAQQRQAAYLKLISIYPLALTPAGEIGEIAPGDRYRVSLTVALWRAAALRQLLRPGESAWDIERQGSRRADEVTGGFYGLSFATRWRPPIPQRHIVLKGRLMRGALPFLEREALRARLARWPVQTIGAWLYDWAYYRAYDALYLLRWAAARLRRPSHANPAIPSNAPRH